MKQDDEVSNRWFLEIVLGSDNNGHPVSIPRTSLDGPDERLEATIVIVLLVAIGSIISNWHLLCLYS